MRLTNDEFFDQLENNFEEGLDLMRRKNADYAGTADPFRNFRGSEAIGLTPGLAIYVRMSDKMARTALLLTKPADVKDETITDTILDLMNYSNILLTWLQTEGKEISTHAGK